MLLGKIVGTLVCNRKDPKMEGFRFMVVKQIDLEGKETGGYRIAVDAVGAGPGEVILYATGSAARQTVETHERPCDAVIMAIVDEWEVDGVYKYRKYPDLQ
ncbi:MAG: EutN/CcmL family microcompartment protein [Myxococcota bacterium]|jgi:microcompartment protein CcmK/EutM|nr:EutN/CcmL family microcompartment protein [Myxococcota bacterium]